MNVRRFTYVHERYLPFLPITLFYGEISLEKEALVDSGATNNVLPYHVGLELGLFWEAQTRELTPVDILRGAPVVGIRLYGGAEGEKGSAQGELQGLSIAILNEMCHVVGVHLPRWAPTPSRWTPSRKMEPI